MIGKVAPSIGAAIGGPFGGVAGKIIQDVLGVKTEQEVYDLLSANPTALLELKKAEIAFEQFMIEADVSLEEIAFKDRDSARQLFSVNIWPQITLSTVFVCGYFWILYSVMNGSFTPPDHLRETMILLLGVLAAEVPRIMAFWMGSSLGSREKTSRMNYPDRIQ